MSHLTITLPKKKINNTISIRSRIEVAIINLENGEWTWLVVA